MTNGNNQKKVACCKICNKPSAGIKPEAVERPISWDIEKDTTTREEWEKKNKDYERYKKEEELWEKEREKHNECRERYEWLQASGVPSRWWWSPALNSTQGNKTAVLAVEAIKKDVDNNKGLFLYGDVGTGKTHLMSLLAQYLILKANIRVVWWDTAKLFITLKSNFGKPAGGSGFMQDFTKGIDLSDNEDIINGSIRATYLFLDDLGREKSSDWTHETLFHIINSRYEQNNNRVVIATNLSPLQLAERTGEQITSRLIEMCGEPVKIEGEDWRLKNVSKK